MSFIKEAESNAKSVLSKLVDKVKDAPTSTKVVAGLLTSAAAIGGLNYLGTKKAKENVLSDLKASYEKIKLKLDDFQSKEEQYKKIFNELSMFAPTVASNPEMASRLLKSKVNKGFNIEDVHRLSAIELNFKHNGPGLKQSPGSAARAAGLSAALNTLTFGTPIALSVMPMLGMSPREQQKKQKDAYAQTLGKHPFGEYEEYDDLTKKAAANVSDETLGAMLSDRYLIFKEAGLLPEIEKTASTFDALTKGLRSGGKALGESASMFLPIAAIGGGAALVKHFIDQKRSAMLDAQAKAIFDDLMKKDEVFQGDKETAMEAFHALRAFAPSMSVRPLVQKTFIQNVIRQGQLDPMTIKDLADGENKILGIKAKGSSIIDSMKTTKDLLGGLKAASGAGWKGKKDL